MKKAEGKISVQKVTVKGHSEFDLELGKSRSETRLWPPPAPSARSPVS